MRTDVVAMKVDMADAADAIREVKRATRLCTIRAAMRGRCAVFDACLAEARAARAKEGDRG